VRPLNINKLINDLIIVELTLTLFVAWVFAYNPDRTITADYLAVFTHLFNGSSHFHNFTFIRVGPSERCQRHHIP
jgi:hypothetical protein